jgi:hypothetical protein
MPKTPKGNEAESRAENGSRPVAFRGKVARKMEEGDERH